MKYLSQPLIILSLISLILPSVLSADVTSDLTNLQQQWVKVNYAENSKENRKIFKKLVKSSNQLSEQYSESAEIQAWIGIINSSYAGVATGMSGLSYAKDAKVYLEKAIELNGDALNGSAYISLGILYLKVPGWPLGFGSDKKALKYLKKGLAINPNGIDGNYFYADFLFEQDKFIEAQQYLDKALNAEPRTTRPLADIGRISDINKLMAEITKKLD